MTPVKLELIAVDESVLDYVILISQKEKTIAREGNFIKSGIYSKNIENFVNLVKLQAKLKYNKIVFYPKISKYELD